jgi:hypothetical protein
MNNSLLQSFLRFYKSNRYWIIGALALVLMLQWCHNKREVLPVKPDSTINLNVSAPHEVAVPDRKQDSSPWTPYLLMVGLTLLFYVAQKRGWIEKMIPRQFMVRTRLFRQAMNGRLTLQILVINTRKESYTIDAPVIEFMRIGSVKAFKIKPADGDVLFPITLTPGTSHQINIDIQQFYERVDAIRSHGWVRVTVPTIPIGNRKSFPKYTRWVKRRRS